MHETLATAEAFHPHHRRHKSQELSGSRGGESHLPSLSTSQTRGRNEARSAGTSPRPSLTARWSGSTAVEAAEVKTPGSPTSPTSRLRQAGMQRRLEDARTNQGEQSDASTESSYEGEVRGASALSTAHAFQVDPAHGPEAVPPQAECGGKPATEQPSRSETGTGHNAGLAAYVSAPASQGLEYATAAEARAFSFGSGIAHHAETKMKPEVTAAEGMAEEMSPGLAASSARAGTARVPGFGVQAVTTLSQAPSEEARGGVVELEPPAPRGQNVPLLSPEIQRIQVRQDICHMHCVCRYMKCVSKSKKCGAFLWYRYIMFY